MQVVLIGMDDTDNPDTRGTGYRARQLVQFSHPLPFMQGLSVYAGDEIMFYLNQNHFGKQGFTENRTIERTLEIGWKLLSMLPKTELTRVTLDEIAQYYKGEDATD